MRERFARFGLELRPEKTRLIEFGRFASENRARRGEGKPETFAFLGFTHLCGERLSDGRFTVQRQTIAKRLREKAKEVRQWLMAHRHDPVAELGRWLRWVVQGYFNYHAGPGNSPALGAFRNLGHWLQGGGGDLACRAWPEGLRGLCMPYPCWTLRERGDREWPDLPQACPFAGAQGKP